MVRRQLFIIRHIDITCGWTCMITWMCLRRSFFPRFVAVAEVYK